MNKRKCLAIGFVLLWIVVCIICIYIWKVYDFNRDGHEVQLGKFSFEPRKINAEINATKMFYSNNNRTNYGTISVSHRTFMSYGGYEERNGEEIVGVYSGALNSKGNPVVVQIAGYTDYESIDVELCISGKSFQLEFTKEPKLFLLVIDEGTTAGDFYLSVAKENKTIHINQLLCLSYDKKDREVLADGVFAYTIQQ